MKICFHVVLKCAHDDNVARHGLITTSVKENNITIIYTPITF